MGQDVLIGPRLDLVVERKNVWEWHFFLREMSTLSLSSIDENRRLVSLDALRGIALFGVLIRNIPDMGSSLYQNHPSAIRNLNNPDWHI